METCEIKDSHRLREDLGIDSVDFLDFSFALEKAFDIEIKDEDAIKIKTVADLKNAVGMKIK